MVREKYIENNNSEEDVNDDKRKENREKKGGKSLINNNNHMRSLVFNQSSNADVSSNPAWEIHEFASSPYSCHLTRYFMGEPRLCSRFLLTIWSMNYSSVPSSVTIGPRCSCLWSENRSTSFSRNSLSSEA